MTATLHIGRRTTPHHPLTGLRARWETFQLKRSRRVQTATFQRLHDALPLDNMDRHALDAPALESAFADLAADHPDTVTPADGGSAAREADREQLLIALRDHAFREAHPTPEHGWSPEVVAAHQRLIADVHACFHPGGDS
ncbi:hypothetical protein [Streptomyces cylindrosporus]|uniref:Uncharacterized protein n=1 Tax=Streptomyces cylindrosporus TaxID=2927583 RepID=A0ABS9YJP5_9ACTN|nr:hypothetical protein [Streptomyces cylindrosporus]MCI3277472.1 hypothetical protein [Streptomyces cylindrosporus]